MPDAAPDNATTADTGADDDTSAQAALAAAQAAQQATDNNTGQDSGAGDGDTTDPKVLADQLAKARREAAGYRQRIKDLEPKAKAHDDAVAASRTEQEKLADELAAAQVELAGFRVEKVRREAAKKAGLDPDLAQFITASDPAEAEAQAKLLLDRLAAKTPPADFRQGTRPQARTPQDKNDLLRQLAGHR